MPGPAVIPKRHARVPIDSIEPHPENPRRGDLAEIEASMREHGNYRAIVVQASTRRILAGEHTWRAAKALGHTHVDVTLEDVGEEAARGILLADNRTNDLATYDRAALLEAVLEAEALRGTLAGTGYTGDDVKGLEDLLAREIAPDFGAGGGGSAEAAAPGRWGLEEGQLWAAEAEDGRRHVLAVAAGGPLDFDAEALGAALEAAGAPPRALWTSIPTAAGGDALEALLEDALPAVDATLPPGAPVLIAHPADARSLAVGRAVLAAGWHFHQTLVIRHNLPGTPVRGRYRTAHTPVLYAWKTGAPHAFYAGRDQASTFRPEDPLAAGAAPEAVARMLYNATRQAEAVLDPLGAGAELVRAAEAARRAAIVVAPARTAARSLDALADLGLEPHPA